MQRTAVMRLIAVLVVAGAAMACGQDQPIGRAPGTTSMPPPATGVASPAHVATPERVQPGEIAFVGHQDGSDHVFLVSTFGELRQLTADREPDASPVWSPDGSMLAFTRGPHEDRDIWVMTADGSEQRNVTNLPGDEFHPAWSPDGQWIAFSHSARSQAPAMPDIMLVALDGTDLRNLTDNAAANDQGPVWSPDGTRIAFGSSAGPDGMAVHVMTVDGAERRVITAGAMATFATGWSPDGEWISYRQLNEFWQVSMVRPDGSDARLLLDGCSGGWSAWSPDAARLLVVTDGERGHHLWVLDGDGSNPQHLTPPAPPVQQGQEVAPTFFAGLSWSPDSTAIAVVMRGSDDALQPALGRVVSIAADGSVWGGLTDERLLSGGVAWRPTP
jgi:Tol biopolymer transport system component